MDAERFTADLEAKPRYLRALADSMAADDPWAELPRRSSLLLLGMGSSHYAASVAAARLRAAGHSAVAELASSDLLPPGGAGTTVVAVSATGESRETLDALDRVAAETVIVALTNEPGSTLARQADLVVPMQAGVEAGGVACRTFQHTLALLIALAVPDRRHWAGVVRRAAVATEDLLSRRDGWLAEFTDRLAGPDGTYVAAPARRLSSAQQAALMLREGPRRAAVACETGDWSHVDVYLTKTVDYRLLVFAGSRWEDELLRWCAERSATVVGVGAELPGAAATLRYRHDNDDDVRLLSEVLVGELIAARLWRDRAGA